MAERTDQDLVIACRGGERGAFAQLVDRYQLKIFNAALRITGDSADAQDVTQSTFLKVFEKLDTFDPKYRFFSWIYKIGINEALNLVGRRRSTELSESGLCDPSADPERTALGHEVGQTIQAALLELKPQLRVAIVLRHFQGLSYHEMGEIIEVPEKTVKSRLFSARRELRAKLAQTDLL